MPSPTRLAGENQAAMREASSPPAIRESLVLDDPGNTQAFNRRQWEVVTMLELTAAIKAGEMLVTGSLSAPPAPLDDTIRVVLL
jgi:hypothetical protein